MTCRGRAKYGEAHCYLLLSTMRVVGRTSGRPETWAAAPTVATPTAKASRNGGSAPRCGQTFAGSAHSLALPGGYAIAEGSLRAGGLIPDKQCVNAMTDASRAHAP